MMTHLAHPAWLWLLPVVLLPLIAWRVYSYHRSHPALKVSSTSAFDATGISWRVIAMHFSWLVKLAAIATLIVILCRPQTHDSWSTSDVEGTDIIIALDVSTSMLARDFKPDRFAAAKEVASQFVNGRENDNMGLVLFAGESYTQVPMTMDNATLINAIQGINMGMLEDGTAIGDGIATSINRIRDGKAKSKSIILLTDGSNNTGVVAPLTAAQVARENGIKIYTIGVGSNGTAEFPVAIDYAGNYQYQRLPVVIDEATLQKIAQTTGGKYYRATSKNVLSKIFKEIDALEKSHLDVQRFTHTRDNYMPWAWLLLALVLTAVLLDYTVLRHAP